MTNANDDIINEFTSTQHGVVSRRQLRSAGLSTCAVDRRVKSGRLVAESGRVLRLAGAPSSEPAQLKACVLDAGPGSTVSHQTAAARWGLPGFSIKPIEVTGKRGRVRNDDPHLGVVHQPRRLLTSHIVEIDGIDTTTPTRTLFDLAGAPGIHPMRLERLLDTCWSRNLVSHASLSRALAELAARGRPGITLMRRLLENRPADHRPPDSSTEARFQQLAHRAGLRAFERQVDVGHDEAWIGRVDFVDRRRNLIVEVDPALFHGSLTDQTRDKQRHAKLLNSGWTVISVTDFDIYHRADVLVDCLRRLAGRSNPVLV